MPSSPAGRSPGTGSRGSERKSDLDGGRQAPSVGLFERIYAVVARVPEGKVTTYGDVSRALFGHARAARTVGWALHGLPDSRLQEVPWWRVINSRGEVSTSCEAHSAGEQRARLEAEGVVFGPADRVNLDLFLWDGADGGR